MTTSPLVSSAYSTLVVHKLHKKLHLHKLPKTSLLVVHKLPDFVVSSARSVRPGGVNYVLAKRSCAALRK